jgi:hypothetical protein
MKPFLFGAFSLLVLPLFVTAQEESYSVRLPDVREEFCGIHINYQYCKCAFHGDYCDAIDHSQSSAYTFVTNEYKRWVGDMIEATARKCLDDGNRWEVGSRTCFVSDEPESAPEQSLEEQYGLPTMEGVPGPSVTGYYGKVSEVEDDVFVYQWSFQRWVRATPNLPLYQGDFVFTREGSTKIIYNGEFGDDVLRLRPASMLETGRVTQTTPREGKLGISGTLGILRDGVVETFSAIQGLPAAQTQTPSPEWYNGLHTPTVVLGIRGTHYVVEVASDSGDTTVTVIEGEVGVNGVATGTAILTAGDQAAVNDSSLSTSSVDTATFLNERGFPPRVDATPEELTHAAPVTPVDDSFEPAPTREELIGDLRDVEAMVPTPGGSTLWLWLLGLIGFAGGFWFYTHRRQAKDTQTDR